MQSFKYEDLKSMQNKHPFFTVCKMLILADNLVFQKNVLD